MAGDSNSAGRWKLVSAILTGLLLIVVLATFKINNTPDATSTTNAAVVVESPSQPSAPSAGGGGGASAEDISAEYKKFKGQVDEVRSGAKQLAKELKEVKDLVHNLPGTIHANVPKPPSPPPPPPAKGGKPANDWEGFVAPSAADEMPTPKCSPKEGADKKCIWKFNKYIPSELEALWWDNIDQSNNHPCQWVKKEPFKKFYDVYRKDCLNGRGNGAGGMVTENKPDRQTCDCDKSSDPVKYDEQVYSRYEYENSCTGEKKYSFIEPMAGVMRHPEYCYGGYGYLIRKDWMIIDQWHIHMNDHVYEDKRAFYLDGGASTWFGGAEAEAWFDATYGQKCQPLDGYWMWEVRKYDPVRIYKELPARVKPKYHWYNIPASTNKNDGDSILFHIKSQAKKEDYVIFKLDIDHNEIESAIVNAMMDDPSIMDLVDEFFWEHHTNMEPLSSCCWGKHPGGEDQKKSITFFRKMRFAGIRAHSWM